MAKQQHDETKAASNVHYLTAADILGRDDREFVDVEVPEWGGVIRLRTLSNEEMVDYTDLLDDKANRKMGNLLLVVRSAIDADGNPLFTSADAEKLQRKAAKAFNRLATAALKLNGVGETAKAEVAAAKND